MLGGLGVLAAAGLVACGDDTAEDTDTDTGDNVPTASVVSDEPEDSGTAVPRVTIEAEIIDASSGDIEINSGDSIIWTNSDDEARTISGEGLEDTVIEPGETFTHDFLEEGTYDVEIEGGESFTVTVLSGLQPEMQGTGVPHVPTSTPTN